METKKITITKEELEKLILEQARVLVGVCMRKFELLENDKQYESKSIEEKNYRKTLKRLIKEQIYEQFRNLKSLLLVFNLGTKFVEHNPQEQD